MALINGKLDGSYLWQSDKLNFNNINDSSHGNLDESFYGSFLWQVKWDLFMANLKTFTSGNLDGNYSELAGYHLLKTARWQLLMASEAI